MHVSPGQVVAAATLAVKIANKMQIGSSLPAAKMGCSGSHLYQLNNLSTSSSDKTVDVSCKGKYNLMNILSALET